MQWSQGSRAGLGLPSVYVALLVSMYDMLSHFPTRDVSPVSLSGLCRAFRRLQPQHAYLLQLSICLLQATTCIRFLSTCVTSRACSGLRPQVLVYCMPRTAPSKRLASPGCVTDPSRCGKQTLKPLHWSCHSLLESSKWQVRPAL